MCFRRNLGCVERGSAWALVTGSALGIGRQYAEQLAAKGYNLYLVDILDDIVREAEIIEHAHRVKCVAKVLDLATIDAAEKLHAETVAKGYTFDVVINNAGMFSHCDILTTPTERIERLIVLHDLTLTMMCRLYGEDMRQRGYGRILNMSSYSIWMPFPGLALYSASKAYTKSFSVAFAKEMRYKNVWVTAVCPAGIATDLYGLNKEWQGIGLKLHALSTPSFCARRGLNSLWRKRMCIVPDWWCKAFIPICGMLPHFAMNWLRNFTMKWQK